MTNTKITTTDEGYSLTETDGPKVILKSPGGETFEIYAGDLMDLALQIPALGYGHTYVEIIKRLRG